MSSYLHLLFYLMYFIESNSKIPTNKDMLFTNNTLEFKQQETARWKDISVKLAGYTIATPQDQVHLLNDYTDEWTERINKFIYYMGLEPTILPDYHDTFAMSDILGKIILTSGQLKGMGTMQRVENVIVHYGYPEIKIYIPLEFKNLEFNYKYQAELLGMGPAGIFDGKIKACQFSIKLLINVLKMSVNRDQLTLNTLGEITLRFRGSLIGYIANILIGVVTPIVQPIIRFVLESYLNYGLNFVMDTIGLVDEERSAKLPIDVPSITKLLPYEERDVTRLKHLITKLQEADPVEKIKVLNEYIDEVLVKIRIVIKGIKIDPFALPDSGRPSETAYLTEGRLHGLTTLQRTGNVIITYAYPNFKIRIPLGFGLLEVYYNYVYSFLLIKSKGILSIIIKKCHFTTDLNVNAVYIRGNVDYFALNTLGLISVHMNGSIMGSMASLLVAAVQPVWQPIVKNAVETQIVTCLENSFDAFNSIVCKVLDNCPQSFFNIKYCELNKHRF